MLTLQKIIWLKIRIFIYQLDGIPMGSLNFRIIHGLREYIRRADLFASILP